MKKKAMAAKNNGIEESAESVISGVAEKRRNGVMALMA
jgi:hypothetical protein